MKTGCTLLMALALFLATLGRTQEQGVAPGSSGQRSGATGPVAGPLFHTTFIRLASDNVDGLLYEPEAPAPKARIALVIGFGTENTGAPMATQMVNRGYRVLVTTHKGPDLLALAGVPELSRGIAYLRTLPGVRKVVVLGHSGGSRLTTIYASVAANGPAACQGRGVLYPCRTEDATGLSKPDGIILLDPAVGASSNAASSFDPAYDDNEKRTISTLDMYDPANGYDPKTGSAHYSADFIKRFSEAQSARNMRYVNYALVRLKAIEAGEGNFSDDEPLVIPGAIEGGNGARLFHTDLSLQEHTKAPHVLLKADGTTPTVIIHSVRPATGLRDSLSVGTMAKGGAINTTVRTFLANFAMRTSKDFAFTADDITGADWKSAVKQAPGMAEGVTVPALVMGNTCFYLMVPGEVLYDHLGSADKTYVADEGADHGFAPCKPEYGDTMKRAFDYVDSWLSRPGRF
jgi:pimeloyl-ACP methyl ester carboxylesterase